MSISKFLSLIVDKSLWFARADHFSDSYEGFAIINIDDPDAKEVADNLRKLSYLNCWNRFVNESFNLWHIYAGVDKYGVAIVSTVEQVKNSIIDENIRSTTDGFQIKYIDPHETYDGIDGLTLTTRKKNWYAFEDEIRFINYQGYTLENPGESVSVNLNTMINRIILSPYVEEWFIAIFKDIVEKYGIDPNLVEISEIRDTMLNR